MLFNYIVNVKLLFFLTNLSKLISEPTLLDNKDGDKSIDIFLKCNDLDLFLFF